MFVFVCLNQNMFEFDLLQKIKLKFDEYMLLRLIKKLDKPYSVDIKSLRIEYTLKNIDLFRVPLEPQVIIIIE